MNSPPTAALDELCHHLGARLSVDGRILDDRSSDSSHHAPQSPQAAAFPVNDEEVVEIAQICSLLNPRKMLHMGDMS